MKKLMAVTTLLLGLLFAAAAPAQFEGKTDLPPIGAGEEDKAYAFLVPEEVTVTTPKGIVVTGGETLYIPGELIHVVAVVTPDTDDAEMAQHQEAFKGAFNQKTQLTKPVDQEASAALIILTVPEGAVIEHTDGRRVEGPAELNLTVSAANLQKMDQATPEPDKKQMGFAGK